MKKLLLLFLIWTYPIVSFSAITECLTDVYFGNGILTDEGNATANTILLKRRIQKDIYNLNLEEYKKSIGKIKEAYNSSHGWGIGDMIESLLQKLSIANFTDMASVISDMSKIYTKLTKNAHATDLSLQVNKYKASIENGRKVLVVAHSQGNLFAYEAYRKLPARMQNYWEAVGVASPGMFEIKEGAPSIAWDNDLVADLALNPFRSRTHCEVRRVYWDPQRDAVGLTLREKKPNSNYVYDNQLDKIYKEDWKAVEGIFEKFDFRVHSFRFYMGEKLAEGAIKNAFNGEILVTNSAKIEIMSAIYNKLNNGQNCPCSNKSSTPVVTHNGAMKMTLSWTYQCDIDMDLTMTGNDAVVYDIKDVEGTGKEHLYIPSLFDINPGDHYVFNANGKQLSDSELTEEELAEDPIEVRALLETTKGDYFNVWPVESFESLNLGDFAEVNVFETIQPEWICPAVNDVSGWNRPYNTDTESFQCLYCPSPYSIEWRKPLYNYQKGSWYCNRPYTSRVYSGGVSRSGGISEGGRTYNACSEEEKKSTCGCVPCDYIVSGMKKRIENGPIAGAKVEIIKASDADGINPTVLYRGSTTDKEDIFQSGLLEIPDATLDTFEDDEYYLVLAEGGKDIDRDDDMVRDTVPTPNNGTIHALLKGSDLKRLPFRVNILTEAIYQVSGDSIGLNYDALTLQNKLDNTAQKLINHKLYPGDDDNRINYKDVLLWTPAVDKKALYKPFTTYVEPIIKNLYENKERFDESYRLIYETYNSDAPQLEPLALEIPAGLDNGIVIAQIRTHNHKSFSHIVLKGNFSEHFNVDDEGYIRIAQSSLIEESNRYRLEMQAVDEAGREGSFVSLLIEVKGQIVQADPTTSSPRFISIETFDVQENAPEGTVVANTYFEDSNQTIVSYSLTGDDNTSFTVDNQGVVTIAANADIDYERSKVYHFGISAINDVGNESYPITISVPIVNQLDTPLFDLVIFEHIEENIPKGSVITTIRTDREGLGDIEKFEILSPHIPFSIDNNGTLIVSNYIDYEQVKQYDFYAIARTKYGNSNKIEVHIVVDDQTPEVGIPTLENLTVVVDENVIPGSKIGQLTLDTGATDIEKIALYGEDDNFRVDNNGSVYLADHAKLDYETKIRYDLGARALNSRGYGNEVHIIVNVNNIADELPILGSFRGAVDENASAGTLIGKIHIGATAEVAIESIEFIGEGSEDFVIDRNGSIYVSNTAQLDYENKKSYVLKAVASSATGFISEGEVIISLYNIPEFVPILKPLSSFVEEHAAIGTVVGTIEVESAGDTTILSFDLNGTTIFSVDENGMIRLVSELDWNNRSQYLFEVIASNSAGASIPVSTNITILRNNYSSSELDDQFTGSGRDETFDTKGGNDVVYAYAGNDIVIGGKGNDILHGGLGDDIYVYEFGDGQDEIYDVGGDDTLKFLGEVTKENIVIERDNDDLLIALKEGEKVFTELIDKIRIKKWFNYENRIEHIEFNNGSNLEISDILTIERDANSERYLLSDNEHLYYFYNVAARTWIGAKNFCEERGLYLTTITSLEESVFIEKHIKENQNYWLGATDALVENNWKWITNEIWNYTNWNSGEPNNLGNENFLEFYGASYKWNDLSNVNMLSPLCEMNNHEIIILNVENFENHAEGWSIVKRESGNELSTFLGRFGGSDGMEDIEKTYHFNEQYTGENITIAFDMYKIDTWDGDSEFNQQYESGQTDKFQVFINHILVIDDIYAEKSKYGITTTNNEFNHAGSEFVFHYEISTFVDENGDVSLGFGSTLNQAIDDESYGIDNIVIRLEE